MLYDGVWFFMISKGGRGRGNKTWDLCRNEMIDVVFGFRDVLVVGSFSGVLSNSILFAGRSGVRGWF